jgi:ABC-2 type transport system ATP-binding protein
MISTAPEAPPVAFAGVTKAYGDQRAVDDLTFTIAPGRVTGFLGPNGAGKSTSMQMLLGLVEPTAGEALVLGQRYADLVHPAQAVGALVDVAGFHPGRRARDELAVRASAAGIDRARVDAVLDQVGLAAAADKRIGQFSLGMRQRLGLATALLGDPTVLVLDEPANGLDPAGMHWLRELLRAQAQRGASVLVSSHVLAELALFADDVVVIDHGRLVVRSSIEDLVAGGSEHVVVRTPDGASLRRVLRGAGASVADDQGDLVVRGLPAESVGELAAGAGVVLHQLRTEIPTLEEIFLGLVDQKESIR